jgi:hypothetical protein
VVRTGRDKKFHTVLRMVDFTFDVELHLAFQHDHQFIGIVNEIFPALAGRIGP